VLFLLYTYSDYFSKKELGEIIKVLSPYQQKSYYGSLLQSMLYEYELRETQMGFGIPPFYSIDLKNNQFEFPSFKEKQIAVLDFWASWCLPCREDSKQLKDLYKKFAGKGLEIVSVSLDEDARNWQAAVKEDSIGSWIHILSSKTWNTKGIKTNLTRQLKIPGIPTYFIVNPTGKIVLRAENIEELYQFVEDFFKRYSKIHPHSFQ